MEGTEETVDEIHGEEPLVALIVQPAAERDPTPEVTEDLVQIVQSTDVERVSPSSVETGMQEMSLAAEESYAVEAETAACRSEMVSHTSETIVTSGTVVAVESSEELTTDVMVTEVKDTAPAEAATDAPEADLLGFDSVPPSAGGGEEELISFGDELDVPVPVDLQELVASSLVPDEVEAVLGELLLEPEVPAGPAEGPAGTQLVEKDVAQEEEEEDAAAEDPAEDLEDMSDEVKTMLPWRHHSIGATAIVHFHIDAKSALLWVQAYAY